MAFAVMMLRRKAFLNQCPILNQPKYITHAIELKKIAKELHAKEKLVVHEELCNGCGNCVISCPPNVSVSLNACGGKGPETEGVIIKIADGKASVVNTEMCRRFEADCTICIDVCPLNAIEFV
jgi:4Fe-4S ferredoxin